MKLIKNMTNEEFSKFRNKATRLPFSEQASFIMELKDYKIYYKNKAIDKWEAFLFGFSSDEIKNNKTVLDCRMN